MKKGDKTPLVLWANKRTMQQNKNVIGIFLGPTGSGKTYAALDFSLAISEMNGTEFNMENNVAFNYKDLLKKTQLKCNDKPGTCYLIEEVGTVGSGGSSGEWQSKANQFMSSFMQTARHRNQILIFTTPNFSLLSKQLRMLVHMTAEMLYVNPIEKCSVAKVKTCQTNPMSGKIYMKYLRIGLNGTKKKVVKTKFKLPPESLLKEYEIEKRKFTDSLNQKIIDFAEESENKSQKKKSKSEEYAEQIIKLRDKGMDNKDIAEIMGVSRQTVYNRLKKANI